MFIVDIKGNQTAHPIGTAFAGVGFKLVLVTQEEISQVVEPERWREYLEQTLIPRMMPGGLIFVLEETIKKDPVLAGYSWRQMFPSHRGDNEGGENYKI